MVDSLNTLNTSITFVRGIMASGISCGIKKDNKKDLALIYSEVPASGAGVFTTNRVKASCVLFNQRIIKKAVAQAIIINSGNANACNGKQGMRDTIEVAGLTARYLKIPENTVMVASTGIIGSPLPMEKFRKGIPMLVDKLRNDGGEAASEAILTTDSFVKKIAVEYKTSKSNIRIAGMAKGAGMICPTMATMLCFIVTDADIETKALNHALKESIEKSFNRISVDGDMSTNDMVIILANRMANNPTIKSGSSQYKQFVEALNKVTYSLAEMIVRDGEGATKLIKVKVVGALRKKDARRVAFCIANSNLVKTALYGKDPNWGRIMAAIGYSGVKIVENKIDLYFDNEKMVNGGIKNQKVNMESIRTILEKRDINISVSLGLGKEEDFYLTSDLNEEYVRINSHYTT